MAEESKTYFLAPTRDCPPSGPIALGSLIASPLHPEMPLCVPLPIDPIVMPIADQCETNWRILLEKRRSGKVGIWSSFLQALGAGADVSVTYDIGSTNAYEFERLETRSFWPTKEYVRDSVTTAPVQAFLASRMFHHNVYMITAIKVAFGASGARTVLHQRGIHVHLGIDGTNSGLPLSAGPQGDVDWGKGHTSSFDGASGFVFAFRLREICYTTKRGAVQREYVKGALFGLKDGDEDREPEQQEEEEEEETEIMGGEEFELLGIADEDVRGEDVDQEGRKVDDDEGGECECIVI